MDTKVFIHIPKCAGTSICRTLGLIVKHRTSAQWITEFGREAWDAAFTFTVVRNPYDRFVSVCAFEQQLFRISEPIVEYAKKRIGWMATGLPFTPIQSQTRLRGMLGLPQSHWLAPMPKRILRFETVAAEFEELFGMKLKHRNRTNHPPWQEVLTPSMIDELSVYYQDDLEL